MKVEVGKIYTDVRGVLHECIAVDEGESQFRSVGLHDYPTFWVAYFVLERWTDATATDILRSIEDHKVSIANHYVQIERHDESIAELKGWRDRLED